MTTHGSQHNARHAGDVLPGPATKAWSSRYAPVTWRIRIRGHMGADWADWFGGLDLAWDNEREHTVLHGPLPDQAALYGVLLRVRDLGLELVAVSSEAAFAPSSRDEDATRSA